MIDNARLIDSFARIHTSLRISVTDRCNIRCVYCMPAAGIRFLPRRDLLSFEEMAKFARIVARLGVEKIRITGGEPLVRHDLHRLVAMLAEVPGIRDIALTTNGILLGQQAERLRRAGLQRVNISLDGLSEETFRRISRRAGLDQVLEGISAARLAGFEAVRLNAVSIRGITESEVVPLGRFARQQGLQVRFIEFMPLDAEDQWQAEEVLTGGEVRAILEAEFGPLVPIERHDPAQPATDFTFADRVGRVGFINSVSEPFCGSCNRLRITSEGKVRNCLFSTVEWDARRLLRDGSSDAQIAQLVRNCVAAKRAGHGSDQPEFARPERAMYQIGG